MKEETKVKKLAQPYLDILENREWSVTGYFNDGRVELEWYSPDGEDFVICVNVENFPHEMYKEYECFDVDDHIAMWIEAKQNGVSGVPNTRRLVYDAEAIDKELEKLADELLLSA